ncbi:hypothetical protein BCR44DRAFT_97391, partial [Catenaria anguillulae PL171]
DSPAILVIHLSTISTAAACASAASAHILARGTSSSSTPGSNRHLAHTRLWHLASPPRDCCCSFRIQSNHGPDSLHHFQSTHTAHCTPVDPRAQTACRICCACRQAYCARHGDWRAAATAAAAVNYGRAE